jgi:glycosyltransferase involved in cell wall biosynthesis
MEKIPNAAVVLSTCNRPELLSGAITNVLDQTYSDVMIIVTDNGNDPMTMEVAERMQKADPRVSYINSSKTGAGPTHNRNFGISHVPLEVPMTFILDDDDRFGDKDSLRALIRALQRKSDALMAYGVQQIQRDNERVHTYKRLVTADQIADKSPQFPAKAMIFRTAYLQAIGGFDPLYCDSAEDFGLAADTLLHAQNKGLPIGFADQEVVCFDAKQSRADKVSHLIATERKEVYLRSGKIVRRKFLSLFGYTS